MILKYYISNDDISMHHSEAFISIVQIMDFWKLKNYIMLW